MKHPLRSLLQLVVLLFAVSSARAQGTGLTGDYYDNIDFTSLKSSRIDQTVNWNWGAAAPTNTMGADTFSVRWSGQIEPLYSETYMFFVKADDGARLWVNDRLLVARTTYSAAALEMSGRITLQAGHRYNLMLEFIEGSGNAQVSLSWSSPSQEKEIIPQRRLFPALGVPERGSILVEHWLNLPGTNIAELTASGNFPSKPDTRDFVTSFECLQLNWADNYGTRASGFIVPPTSGNYVFAVSGDDAVQLFLSTDTNAANRRLIASNAVPTPFRQFTSLAGQISAPIALLAHQKYFVELLHKEGTGNDHFSVAWQTPGSTSFTVIPADTLVPGGLHLAQPAETNYLDTLAPSHPRLLASPERFEWLKRAIASNTIPQLTAWWATISKSASGILSQPVSVYAPDNRGTILNISRKVIDRVYKCALVYRMNGDTTFAERAWAELQQVASSNFPDWHPGHFLDTAEMTHAAAVGYDWLYDYWTQPRRDTIRNAIITKGLNQSLTLYKNNSSWVASSSNNWNLVCNGGMIMGALAIGEKEEPLSEYILSKAVASAGRVMRHYTTDNGGWYEGPGYWDYTTDYNMHLMAALESALGSDFGLSDTCDVWETGMFPLYMVGPTRLSFNFADAGAGNMHGPQLLWISRRFNRPELAWHERNNGGSEVLDLLWYDTRGSDPQTMGLQPDNYFRGPSGTTSFSPADAVTLRSAWQDADATFIGFKTGEIGASHGHLDAGSFVFDALGKRWAHDLAGDDYALPGYFSEPQRWTYYRLRAEGHNTLVINPGNIADQVDGVKPPVVLYTSEPNVERSAVVADLTSAYGITRVWRGVQLFRLRRWALVQDEIQAASPATVWWFMHINTSTTAQIDADGSAVMLTQSPDRVWLKVLSGGASFSIANAVPLPTSPNPSGQNTNAGYRKLSLRLSGVTNTTLAVLMVPLNPGENPPTTLPALTPLADWGAPPEAPPIASFGIATTPEDTAVDVDLWPLAFDLYTPTNQLQFRVSGATNGSVALLADGHTASFSPATNYFGPASFNFSFTDTRPTPLSASNAVNVNVTSVNDPPLAGPGGAHATENSFVDVDLWTLASDVETEQSNLLFAVSSPVKGSVSLLADGHTSRFTPTANFTGAACFQYTVSDLAEDPRTFAHYSFEPPLDLAGGVVPDVSLNGRDATLLVIGAGEAQLTDSVPAALSPMNKQSLALTENGDYNGGEIRRVVDATEMNFNDEDWTAACWFKRNRTTNDDFIFYLGTSDGFGSADELQLYCPNGSTKLTLCHYNAGSSTMGSGINSSATAGVGQWHYAAVTFTRTNASEGLFALYLDGVLIGGKAGGATLAMPQPTPVIFGGHHSTTFKVTRWFDGCIDEAVIFRGVLSAEEISRLAAHNVTRFGGLTSTNIVVITVQPPNTATITPVSDRTLMVNGSITNGF